MHNSLVPDPAVSVRVADDRDVDVVAALHLSTALHAYADIFPPDAPPPALAALIDDWNARIGACRPARQAGFVAVEREVIVGVIAAGPAPRDPSDGHLSRLYVEPARWGNGIGRVLHDHAVAHLRGHRFRRATLWVLEANADARRFYERLGWTQT